MKHNSQILSQSACQNPVRHQLWDYYAIATERTICPDLCFGLEDVTLHPNTLERQGNRMVSFRVLALFCHEIGCRGIIALSILPLFEVLIII